MLDIDVTDDPAVILIVEDNELLQEAYREVLRMSGYRTVSALTGEEALRLAREQAPNLILLDIMLPDLLGWEIQQRLASDLPTRSVPVVEVSAIGDPDAPSRAQEAGFAAFLPKPVRIAELVRQVEAVLRPAAFLETEIGSRRNS
jgi:DNA-binding response OmpR family regulator